ncbi:MAG: DUF309 domain-containing protein [Sulfurovum sp.]|nr:DUF309 domain-containing protein [Sulfurovum sp.]
MLSMNEDLEGALCTYVELLEDEEYFEAHEVLEEAWHPLRLKKHPLANLAKGLINGAIAFEHIKRNKNHAKDKAIKVLASYERHKHLCVEGGLYSTAFQKAIRKIEQLKQEKL